MIDKECCATCRRNLTIARNDYSDGGCRTDFLEGFVCMAFADEGIASWMVGLDPETGRCEMWGMRRDGKED